MDKTEFLTIYATYENLEVVKKTLPSVIEETKRNNAKLIVHDASEKGDGSKWKYLKELNKHDDFFLILSSNMSMAHARNMCFHLGQELYMPDYICMMEDDHGFNPGIIQTLIQAMKKYYGKVSPTGLRYGLFTACQKHAHAKLNVLDNEHEIPVEDASPWSISGCNSCFRCAPTNHWNTVLKGYDVDEYLISYHQTKHLRWRNYHRGFTVLFVGKGRYMFDIESIGRGDSTPDDLRLWDTEYCASDIRSRYLNKPGSEEGK